MTMTTYFPKRMNHLHHNLLSICLFVNIFTTPVQGLKHNFQTFADSRSLIGPVGMPFAFLPGGHYDLTVYDFELKVVKGSEQILDEVEAGFFLKSFKNEAAFHEHMEILRNNETMCAFEEFRDSGDDLLNTDDDEFGDVGDIESAKKGILLSMKSRKRWKPATPNIDYTFKADEEGLYFLIYQLCPPNRNIRSTFELDFHFRNYDRFGNENYLTAGEIVLPRVFFFFSMSYLICFIIWFTNNREIQKGKAGLFDKNSNGRALVYPIHHLMSVLLLVKFLTVFFECIRYYVIGVSGHAELWSFVYYIFTFIKGTFLFTVILLIGTGWSFVKPFLSPNERKVIFFILVLQIISNIALIVLSQETEGENPYEKWTAVLHLADIICCCAVLIPIVWQVNSLEKSINPDGEESEMVDPEEREMGLESGEKREILSKLKLFRSFYMLVVVYIYSTRILIFLFANMLDYKHLWIREAVVELITLTFYVSVGIMFRPRTDNPYLSVRKDEDEGIVLQRGLELERVEHSK